MHVYSIEMSDRATEELEQLRPFDRRPVVQAIRLLSFQAEVVTRNRRPLREPLDQLPTATWEVRVGKHRVFYEIRERATVRILRVIIKAGTTAESL